jgi:dimethylargininase
VSAPTALVRRPSPRLAEGLLTHLERRPVDVALAREQWHSYVEAMAGNGWNTVEVTPADDCPDGVFVEDTVVVVRGGPAVVANPGAPERRSEVDAVEQTVRELGLKPARITTPGTLDGGDVLKVGDTFYVGRGGRTNDEGIAQLSELVATYGVRIVAVDVTRVLHLKSAVTALPDGTVIGYPPCVDDPSVFPSFLPVPEESGAHVVLLGDGRLLMAADAPESATMFRAMGYETVCVDISEFQKLEGCVTCLSVRIRS